MRYRRRRCMPREPSRDRRAGCRALRLSRRAEGPGLPRARQTPAERRSLVPVLLVGFSVFLEIVDVLVTFQLVLVCVVLVFVVVVVVVLVSELEVEGRRAGHFEIGATVRAANQVPLVDVEFVDLNLRITFRTGGHTRSALEFRILPRT